MIFNHKALNFFFIIGHLACSCAAGDLPSPSSSTNIVSKNAQSGPLPATLSFKPTKRALEVSRVRI